MLYLVCVSVDVKLNVNAQCREDNKIIYMSGIEMCFELWKQNGVLLMLCGQKVHQF
jgi:xanthine dehydrogenase iron-sulfur cluster and FAD-binding subunit A